MERTLFIWLYLVRQYEYVVVCMLLQYFYVVNNVAELSRVHEMQVEELTKRFENMKQCLTVSFNREHISNSHTPFRFVSYGYYAVMQPGNFLTVVHVFGERMQSANFVVMY